MEEFSTPGYDGQYNSNFLAPPSLSLSMRLSSTVPLYALMEAITMEEVKNMSNYTTSHSPVATPQLGQIIHIPTSAIRSL